VVVPIACTGHLGVLVTRLQPWVCHRRFLQEGTQNDDGELLLYESRYSAAQRVLCTPCSYDNVTPMKRVPIHFLPVQVPGRRKTRRERELERAQAKSHSSRVSYRKAFRPYKNDDTYLVLPEPITDGGLDPFIQLATDLSTSERSLLQSCTSSC
jgi:hypothetical protein